MTSQPPRPALAPDAETRPSAADRRWAARAAIWAVLALAAFLALRLFAAEASAQPDGADPALCANPTERCGALIAAECIGALGAGSIAAVAAPETCRAQLGGYRDCMASVAETCPNVLGGGGPSAEARALCETRADECVVEAERAFRDCRRATTGACRAECRDEWDLARESCARSTSACGATGVFRPVAFLAPECLAPTAPREPDGGAPAPQSAALGSICRSSASACPMLVAAPVGVACGCSANPSLGAPAFAGVVAAQ